MQIRPMYVAHYALLIALVFIAFPLPAKDGGTVPRPPVRTLPRLDLMLPEDVIAADVAAQNEGHWDLFLRLRTEMPGAPEAVESYNALWRNGDLGIRGNVVSAHLSGIRQLPFDVAREMIGSCCYVDQLFNPQAFYAIVEYSVRAEDKYAWNGPNARLYILDDRGDGWKIVQVSEPPLAAIDAAGFGIGSAEEQMLLERQHVRTRTGQFVNSRGDLIYSVNPTVTGDHQIPASITVAHSMNFANGCTYLSMIGCVDFNTYVKNVVPNEWGSTWPAESLKAGAMAAKMYGWYHVYYAKYPNKGYDVLDQDCDQVYVANSAKTTTSAAVDAVAGVGYDRSDGVLFETQYSAGTYSNAGYHGGRIYQNGTRWLADNGYSYTNAYQDMIRYYYDSSSLIGGRTVRFFTYTEGGSGCASSLNVTVTSPVGGENWQVGTTHTISWSVSGTTTNINYWKIALSTDGGATWPTTNEDPRQISGGIFNPSSRSWSWLIPSTWNTTQARIRVRALDVNGNILKDGISPANFTLSQASETISNPSTPSGPSTGSTGTSYSYSVSGSSSSLGHSVQYQINWGDGQSSGWLPAGTTSSSHSWSSSGSYNVTAQARCTTHTSAVSSTSGARSVAISASETVSPPSTPSGSTSGTIGTSYSYSAGSASSNLGHSIQYRFDWGDGETSGWLTSGTTTASHSWSSAGTYGVKAQARCVTHTSVTSGYSNLLSVTISGAAGETVSTPSAPAGPETGTTSTSYAYTTGGSASSLGHSIQYQFNWGDGQQSGWLSPGVTTASHAWTATGNYAVRTQVRCATHTSIVSNVSNTLSVAISGGGGGSELIVDGGFEAATATGNVAPGWDVYPSSGSGHSLIIVSGAYPHQGSNYANLGGTDGTEYDWLIQRVTIPADAVNPSLSAWVSISTEEVAGDGAYDYLWLALYNTAGDLLTIAATLSNEDATSSGNTLGSYFRAGPIDLSAYKGMTVDVTVVAYTDYVLPTTFLVDDVSLQLGSGTDAAPATSITNPGNGATVSGSVNVSATASDDNAVTSLEILVDGVVKASTSSSSLNYTWNTTVYGNGMHTLVSRAGDAAGHVTTSDTVTVTVTNVVLAAPTNVVAIAASASQVDVAWTPVTGASNYQVFRSSNNGGYALVSTVSAPPFSNTGLSANTAYLYFVKAVDAASNVGPASNVDVATTIVFSDDPVVAGVTTLKSAHFGELRTAVNAVRSSAGLSAATFTGSLGVGGSVYAVHLAELRSYLDAARAVLGLPALSYTDAVLMVGATRIKAAHVTEVRSGVK